MRRGASLAVVGTGYVGVAHLTAETLRRIRAADLLFVLGPDVAQRAWLRARNPTLADLHDCYRVGMDRAITYSAMANRVLAPLARGRRVCAAFYGHPGVFVAPSHDAIRRARKAGHLARMYPGISAEDCLFADLGVDPAEHGCQSYEATNFLSRAPRIATSSALVLWQIGAVGVRTYRTTPLWSIAGLRRLVRALRLHYPPDHEVVVYEASSYAVCEPSIVRVPLARLPSAGVTVSSTLYVPPLRAPSPGRAMMRRLGIPASRPRARRTRPVTARARSAARGRLIIVGTGCAPAGQITLEAAAWIRHADAVFDCQREGRSAAPLPRARSLRAYVRDGGSVSACTGLVNRIVAPARAGRDVCAAFSGHPAVLGAAAHLAIHRARALGCEARMLPGISLADCLYADLGVDPARQGCQLYEATDFLLRRDGVETGTPLILLSVHAIGTLKRRAGLALLAERLASLYPADHEVILYAPARRPGHAPTIEPLPLRRLAAARPTIRTALFVPARGA